MSIIQKRNELLFSISNNVEEVKSSLGNTGIGLKNVRRRLELTYSDFTFEAQHKDDLFVVSLYINLNSNEA